MVDFFYGAIVSVPGIPTGSRFKTGHGHHFIGHWHDLFREKVDIVLYRYLPSLSILWKILFIHIVSSDMMVIDRAGYRLNVGIVLINESNRVFWGRRSGHDAWQFPQGGLSSSETAQDAMYRELYEEVGLERADVELLGSTKRWLKYRLPKQYLRHGTLPLVIGQKQKWFLLKLITSEQKIRLDLSDSPEFDSWRWIDFHEPAQQVIFFKRQVYADALTELEPLLKARRLPYSAKRKKR
jgi:putative (di)nucleoside polyphosphate hydrolase